MADHPDFQARGWCNTCKDITELVWITVGTVSFWKCLPCSKAAETVMTIEEAANIVYDLAEFGRLTEKHDDGSDAFTMEYAKQNEAMAVMRDFINNNIHG